MATAVEHYATHLAGIYLWMVGGAEAGIARGDAEIAALGIETTTQLRAVDLGAGFGMHAVPLARRGWSVLAIDSSAELLSSLKAHAGSLPIRAVEGELLSFTGELEAKVDLILCMGDTLTHLSDRESVEVLIGRAAGSLSTGGRLILTFRDYTQALLHERRFIPVRSDEHRILTCFLEYWDDRVEVTDIVHENSPQGWKMHASFYQKLRLPPEWLRAVLARHGFAVRQEAGISGMVRLVATRI